MGGWEQGLESLTRINNSRVGIKMSWAETFLQIH